VDRILKFDHCYQELKKLTKEIATIDRQSGPLQMESSPPITAALQPLATEPCLAESAGRVIRCWYQISANDRFIATETERLMAEPINEKEAITLQRSHASMATHPDEIVTLIEAASSVLVA
jgi:hypothetical protein